MTRTPSYLTEADAPTTLTVAQTLAGGWTITMPNPYEDGWHTELLATEQDNECMRDVVAAAALRIKDTFAPGSSVRVTSHSEDSANAMKQRIFM